MSGFAACFNRNFSALAPQMIDAISEFMAYRGSRVIPHYPAPFIAMCAPESAISRDELCTVIGDVRLDARHELITRLQGYGCDVSASSSDMDLIRWSYRTWNAQLTDFVFGDLGFVIWDEAQRSLFCMRDHFGVKPIYYENSHEIVFISNTHHALHFHPHSTHQLNSRVVAEYLASGYTSDQYSTFYENILRLPPAHTLQITPDQQHIERYWSLLPGQTPPRRSEEAYMEEFDTLFYEAVKDRLPTGSIGVNMSGGLDSTAIAAYIKRVLKDQNRTQDLTALTIIHGNTDPEKKYSMLAADHLGLRHVLFDIESYRPFAAFEEPALRFLVNPGMDNNAGRHLRFHKLAEMFSSRLFTGHQGDGIFQRTKIYFGQLIAQKKFYKLAHELALYYRTFGKRPLLNLNWLLQEKTGQNVHKIRDWESQFPNWIREDLIQQHQLDSKWYAVMYNWYDTFPIQHSERHYSVLSLGIFNSPTFYELSDPGSTGSALDSVHPFVDMRIVKFGLNLPNTPFTYQKRLLRKVLSGILPDEVVNRPKTVVSSNQWKNELSDFIGPGLETFEESPFIWDFIDKARFRAMYPPRSNNEDRLQYLVHLRPANFMLWYHRQMDLLSEIDVIKRKIKL